jgi:group I intron endonuclease
MTGIYKITNPEGQIYVGQSLDINKRFNDYKGHYCKGQVLLYLSLKKYGWFYHIFEIIEECSEDQLNIKEQYWINYYNCILNGLNQNVGGKARINFKLSDEAKRIKSEKMTKIWAEKRFKRKLGKKIKNIETGIIYESCLAASDDLKVVPATISKWCKEGKKLQYVDNWKIRPSKL